MHEADCNYLGIKSFRTCFVPHCNQSYAASLTFPYENLEQQQKLFKLTYSGDTMPSKQLIKLGHNSTLLIHEATFADRMRSLAKDSQHSTVSQAIQQAQEMCAEYTILTHFSGRKDSPFVLCNELPERFGVAFDFMQVSPNDLPRLSDIISEYQIAFQKKTESRQRQKSRDML